jgi:hypothetical protein
MYEYMEFVKKLPQKAIIYTYSPIVNKKAIYMDENLFNFTVVMHQIWKDWFLFFSS